MSQKYLGGNSGGKLVSKQKILSDYRSYPVMKEGYTTQSYQFFNKEWKYYYCFESEQWAAILF